MRLAAGYTIMATPNIVKRSVPKDAVVHSATVSAPTNIAVIKYWGKVCHQLLSLVTGPKLETPHHFSLSTGKRAMEHTDQRLVVGDA